MAKKKSTSRKNPRKGTSQVPTLVDHSSLFMNSMLEASKKTFGDTGIVVGAQTSAAIVGIPFSALALRVLFNNTCFPLSRITHVAGLPGSCKTAFMNECGRWHLWYGGFYQLAENENKDASVMRNGTIQGASMIERVTLRHTYSMEEWQDFFTWQMNNARDIMDADDGPGKTLPVFFAVDSLTATDTQDAIDSVNKSGHASLDYARLANLIARYMRTISSRIANYPFTVLCTNHLKTGTDRMGRPSKTTPGGLAPKFMETYEIHMSRISRIEKIEYEGVRVKMQCAKNSHGVTGREIEAEFIWWWEETRDGGLDQKFMWDWDTASVEYLAKLKDAKGKKSFWNAINDVVDLHPDTSKRKIWSKKMGLPSSSDAISFREFGRLLEGEAEIMQQIHNILRIPAGNLFQPGIDYRQQLAAAASQVEAATAAAIEENAVEAD